MFKKYGLIPLSRNLSNKLLLNKVIEESWLIVVEGNWQGSPIKSTFLTPVCKGIKIFG